METSKTTLRFADLPNRADTTFAIEPDAAQRAEIAESLGIPAIRKLRFNGLIRAEGKHDWVLFADLGATVVQDCVITLEPVTTRIDQKIKRTYLSDIEDPLIGEVEMPEDDTVEELPTTLNLVDVMTEALALALPDFPRADGAELGEVIFTEPGVAPMRDEDTRPFAGLSSLKDALEKKDESGA